MVFYVIKGILCTVSIGWIRVKRTVNAILTVQIDWSYKVQENLIQLPSFERIVQRYNEEVVC